MPDGTEQPIVFSSRTSSSTERGYAKLEKGALALINGVRKFHKYLIGRKFTLVTDHTPLLKILEPKQRIPTLAAARLQRWAIVPSAYDYDLEFTSRINNQKVDMLSRLPLPVEAIDPNEITHHINYLDTVLPVTILSRVLKYTLERWPTNVSPELHSYAKRTTEVSVTERCLIYGGRVVIPYSLQKTSIVRTTHKTYRNGADEDDC